MTEIHLVFEDFARDLDELVKDIDDPAKAVAFSVRHIVRCARHDPVWGQFLLREGYSARVLTRGLGKYLLRDLARGVMAGRFTAPDLLLSAVAVGGTVLAAVSAGQQSSSERIPEVPFCGAGDSPERTAAMVMGILGLPPKEAAEISRFPLPDISPDSLLLRP